ncbi:MAG: JAB domain-containing protein [Caldisericia bacterium]
MENIIKIVSLRLVVEKEFPWEGTISSPTDVYKLLRQHLPNMLLSDKEMVVVVGLAGDNSPRVLSIISIGTSRTTFNSPAQIFRLILTAACESFVVIHNHPSGHLIISDQDKENAVRLKHASDIVDIEMIDSIVVTQNGFISWVATSGQREENYFISQQAGIVNDTPETDKAT